MKGPVRCPFKGYTSQINYTTVPKERNYYVITITHSKVRKCVTNYTVYHLILKGKVNEEEMVRSCFRATPFSSQGGEGVRTVSCCSLCRRWAS